MPKSEILHYESPFSMLTRREMIVRKLMVKFHDDPAILRRSMAAVAYGFDPRLAERTHAEDKKSYTQEERVGVN